MAQEVGSGSPPDGEDAVASPSGAYQVQQYHGPQAQPVAQVSAPSAPVAFRDFSSFIDRLTSPQAVEQSRALANAYNVAVRSLLGEDDVQKEGGREFKKKSAWRKLGRHFFISVREVETKGWWEKLPHDDAPHYHAESRVEATAPWGQVMPGLGACSTRESRFYASGIKCPKCGGAMWDNRNDTRGPEDFACRDKNGCGGKLMPGEWAPGDFGRKPNEVARGKAEHDCLATAQTRAMNRAISELIAAGEVTWEEVQGGEVGGAEEPVRQRAPRATLDMDTPLGYGVHKERSWRELVGSKDEKELDYVRWALGMKGDDGLRKLNPAQRKELLALYDAQHPHQPDGGGPGAEAGKKGPAEPQAGPPLPGQAAAAKPAMPTSTDLSQLVGFGQHKALSWQQVIDQHPDYIGKVLHMDFGERYAPKGSPLREALETAWRARRAASEQAQEKLEEQEPAGPSFADQWDLMVRQYSPSPYALDCYAWAHPQLPLARSTWAEPDYEVALRGLNHPKGVHHVLDSAMQRAKTERGRGVSGVPADPNAEPKPVPPSDPGDGRSAMIPAKLTARMQSALVAAARHDVPRMEEWREQLRAAVAAGNARQLEVLVNDLQQVVFAHASGKGEPAPAAPQPSEQQGDLLKQGGK